MVALLLARGASARAKACRKFTALHYAASIVAPGRHALMQALLDAGASPSAKNQEDRTSLHLAALSLRSDPSLHDEYAKMSSVLVESGADVEARDCFGRSADDSLKGVVFPITREPFTASDGALRCRKLSVPSEKPASPSSGLCDTRPFQRQTSNDGFVRQLSNGLGCCRRRP